MYNAFQLPKTVYRAPLTPVTLRAQAIEMLDCSYEEKQEPYSKFTCPHFMENNDEEKYIVNGKCWSCEFVCGSRFCRNSVLALLPVR